MKTDYEFATIIEDSESDKEDNILTNVTEKVVKEKVCKKKVCKEKVVKEKVLLKNCYNEDENVFEIGVDEVGRGPLFGRVYTAAVVLPKDNSFDCSMVKDSKKFHSKQKIEEASNYIKEHALAWHISFEDERTIDEINILQATQKSMHSSILEIIKKNTLNNTFSLLIDGNYFKPLAYYDKNTTKNILIPYTTIEGGDNKYASIAAASIIAKVERDKYIHDLCIEEPTLTEYYGINSNKGYGAKRHIDGIKEHGITIWHRKSFGICKKY
jgi:ribonuclease HII